MDVDSAVCRVRGVKPVWTPWFTSAHTSDEGATFLGALVVMGVIERDGGPCFDMKHHDLYVTSRGEYLRRFGDEQHEYGSLGDMAPPGTSYALAARLAAARAQAPESFVPCAWLVSLPDQVDGPRRTGLPF